MEKTRIQKIIADSGYCSRRRAEEHIAAGEVRVNGRLVSVGDKADAKNDIITVKGERINVSVNLRYIKMYKPRGYITAMSDARGGKLITELLKGIEERVYPVGRLDRNSEGLILLTNDGAFANAITHPGSGIQKKYRVTVPSEVSEEKTAMLSAGVDIGEGIITQPCIINTIVSGSKDNPRTVLEFIISEGKNRQIRRMCDAVGLTISRLRRISVGGVRLGMMRPGEYKDLTRDELFSLQKQIKNNDGGKKRINDKNDNDKKNGRQKRRKL